MLDVANDDSMGTSRLVALSDLTWSAARRRLVASPLQPRLEWRCTVAARWHATPPSLVIVASVKRVRPLLAL
jgi:hypothetical protein